MSDEYWREQGTPEASRAREADRLRESARQRGEDLPAREALRQADRVIRERAASERLDRQRREDAARQPAAAASSRGPAGQMAARHPLEDIRRTPRVSRQGRSR